MKHFASWAIGLSALFCVFAFSDTPQNQFVMEKGKPVDLRFKDGRVAEFMINRRDVLETDLPIKITDNSCTNNSNISCEYRLGLILNDLTMAWVVHPDASKIGKTVTMRYQAPNGAPPMEFPLFQQGLVAFSDRGGTPKLAVPIPNDIFNCKDFSWLPPGNTEAPSSISFARWDAELMFPNPETGLMENRTISMAMDFTMNRNSSGGLEIGTVKKYLASSQVAAAATLWSLITKDTSGNYCPITVTPNAVPLGAAIAQYQAAKAPHFVAYIYGDDEYSDVAQPFFLNQGFYNDANVQFN